MKNLKFWRDAHQTITLRELIDQYGANGVIRIDAGNGSAGPAWIDWEEDIDNLIGGTIMSKENKNKNAYQEDCEIKQSLLQVVKHVIHDYAVDDDNTLYVSAWIEDDLRNAPYQATNPYRYRLIF